MKGVLAFLALVGFVQAFISYDDVLEAEFQTFKAVHGKSYNDDIEEQLRKLIFKDNKELIDKHNERFDAGEVTYEMGINQFTDLLPTEFASQMLSSINRADPRADIDYIFKPSENADIPESVDWRSKGAVTAVKNQGHCGSCWAFSAIGSLEGHHFKKTNELVSLSEQNLVDCAVRERYNNKGCKGGWPASALKYIQDNGGVDTEESYPYKARNGRCHFNKGHIGAKVVGIAMVTSEDEAALAAAVADKGPVSVAVDASLFQHYKAGILNDPSCTKPVSHGIVVVGYGHDHSGGDFWLAKNSWGTRWGEKGYIRMARNRKNQCHIASFGVYPLV